MESLKELFRARRSSNNNSKSNERFKTLTRQETTAAGRVKKNWWTPLWTGLVSDRAGKHRRAMGASLWLYLYLLAHANRKTGVVRKKQRTMSSDTGLPVRTVQRHLKRLASGGYIAVLDSGHEPRIRIEKYKLFYHSPREAVDTSSNTKE